MQQLALFTANTGILTPNNSGHSRCCVGKLRQEIQRLEEVKRANMQQFVTSIRAELLALWDQCYYSQSQRSARGGNFVAKRHSNSKVPVPYCKPVRPNIL
jgi:hypothetical protein